MLVLHHVGRVRSAAAPLATAFLASGILFVGIMLVGTTALASGVISVEFVHADIADSGGLAIMSGFGTGLLLIVVPRIQAVFLIGTSRLSARTEAIPQWLTYFGYLIALVMIVMPIVWEPIAFAFPVWVAVTSVVLFIRRRTLG